VPPDVLAAYSALAPAGLRVSREAVERVFPALRGQEPT
jgi:hypothetical protein